MSKGKSDYYHDCLAFHYGDNDALIKDIKDRIEKYSNAPQTIKVIMRVQLLKRLLEEAEG